MINTRPLGARIPTLPMVISALVATGLLTGGDTGDGKGSKKIPDVSSPGDPIACGFIPARTSRVARLLPLMTTGVPSDKVTLASVGVAVGLIVLV